MYARQRPAVSRGDAFALGILATGAISVAIAALVSIVRRAIAMFGSDAVVRMPVTGGEVPALEGVSGIAAAEYTSVDVTVTTLPAGVSWMLLLEGALPALATIGVCVVAWWLGISLIRGRPFRRAMATTITIAACLVIVGSVFGQLLGAFGRAELVNSLAATDPGVTDTFWVFLLELDLSQIGWGFALALVAGAFAIGSRLQRETDLLV